MHSKKYVLIGFLALLGAIGTDASAQTRHIVLVVLDGMRPDFVTEKNTPALNNLAREGVLFRNHHSVYPTATDVNGAALATGCYPNRNGLAANLEFRPAINSREPIDMGDPDSIKRGDEVSGGKYLSMPTFVELMRAAGKKVALVGVKSVALLFDRHNDWTYARSRGKALTIFAAAPLGSSARDEMIKILGPIPDDPGANPVQRNHFATRALTEFFWRDGVPDFSLLWLSEPDLAQHNFGPGSPEAIAAIKAVDDDVALMLHALEQKKVRDATDILVVSDHGFSTIRRPIDVVALLNKAGFRAAKEFSDSPKPGDILVAGNGGTVLFYIHDHDGEVSQRLVDWLQHRDFAGMIFSREKFEGTFSLSDVHIDSQNNADVVLSFRGSENRNGFGVAGMIDADWNRKAGDGTHATMSKFDVHNFCVAQGPDFQHAFESEFPSGNIDIAPSILGLLRVRSPNQVDGRVLNEAMISLPDQPPVLARPSSNSLHSMHHDWQQSLVVTQVAGAVYFNEQ